MWRRFTRQQRVTIHTPTISVGIGGIRYCWKLLPDSGIISARWPAGSCVPEGVDTLDVVDKLLGDVAE